MKNDFQIPSTWIHHLRDSYRVLWKNYREHGKLHSTFLFTGSAGIGKRIAALDFLKGIYCDTPTPDYEPCESCRSCHRFSQKQIIDHYWMEPEENGVHKIEPFRELQTKLGLGPIEEPFVSCVIARADAMTTAAANSMLKTFEEPPKKWLFILTARSSDLLLPTIRSRTLEVRFRPMPQDLLHEVLTLNHSADSSLSQIRTASALGQGSYAQAAPYLNEDAWELRKLWFGFLQDPAREWHPFFEKVSSSEEQFDFTLDLIESFSWDLVQLLHQKEERALNQDQIEFLKDFLARYKDLNESRILHSFDEISYFRKTSQTAVNLKTKTQILLNIPLRVLGLA